MRVFTFRYCNTCRKSASILVLCSCTSAVRWSLVDWLQWVAKLMLHRSAGSSGSTYLPYALERLISKHDPGTWQAWYQSRLVKDWHMATRNFLSPGVSSCIFQGPTVDWSPDDVPHQVSLQHQQPLSEYFWGPRQECRQASRICFAIKYDNSFIAQLETVNTSRSTVAIMPSVTNETNENEMVEYELPKSQVDSQTRLLTSTRFCETGPAVSNTNISHLYGAKLWEILARCANLQIQPKWSLTLENPSPRAIFETLQSWHREWLLFRPPCQAMGL